MASQSLTALNKAVLLQISKEGFQSFYELKVGALNDVSKSHTWRILKQLCEMGLLRKFIDHKGMTLGWSINKDAAQLLKKIIPGISISVAHTPNYQTAFSHDLLLREIKKSFERTKQLIGWTSEGELRHKQGLQQTSMTALIPDARIEVDLLRRHSVGYLELELSRKKKSRIQSKIEKYLLNKEVDFVLYAVGSPGLAQFVQSQVDEVRKRSVKVRLSPRKIPVVVVDALGLRQQPMELLKQKLEIGHAPGGASTAN